MPFTLATFLVQLAVALALQAVGIVIGALTRPSQEGVRPAGLSEFTIPTADEGRPIPVVFGTVLITGANVVWVGDLKTEPIKARGGKK